MVTAKELHETCGDDLIVFRRLPDGRMLFVYRQLFNTKLGIGDMHGLNEFW
jgi:hypothetical protein